MPAAAVGPQVLPAAYVAGVTGVAGLFAVEGFRPQDGDHHAHLAAIYTEALTGGSHVTTRLTRLPWPNQLADIALAGGETLVGLQAAEVLLLAMLAGGLCAALSFFWHRNGWDLLTATAVAAPFAIGSSYGLGFYNFQLSIILALFTAAAATTPPGHDGTQTAWKRPLIWIGLGLTWLSHIFGFGLLLAYLIVGSGTSYSTLRTRLLTFWPALIPPIWWILQAPSGTVGAGEFNLTQRVVAVASWDAFLTVYNNTERIAVVILASTIYLVVVAAILTDPGFKERSKEPASRGLALLTIAAALFGLLTPPSAFQGSYIWHRAGMVTAILALALIGRTVTAPASFVRAFRPVLIVVALGAFLGISAARYGTVTTVAAQRAEILTLAQLVETDDVVAAVSGPTAQHSGTQYTRAYPLEHVAGRVATDAGAEFISNIVIATGQAAVSYTDEADFLWGRLPTGPFEQQPFVPTVFVAIGEIDSASQAQLRSEGFEITATTSSGLASLWRR